jgi:hypothetical protein
MAGRLAIIANCERREAIPEGCADRLPDCVAHAQTTLAGCGQKTGLLLSCPETCAACEHYAMLDAATRCEDKNEMCAEWAKKGERGHCTERATMQAAKHTNRTKARNPESRLGWKGRI